MAVTGYKLYSIWRTEDALRAIFDDGSDYSVALISYRPSLAGQPPVSKVLIRHVSLLLWVYGDRPKIEKLT